MRQGLGVDHRRQGTVAEAVLLFVVPPLLTLAVVALSLYLYTCHLTRKDLRTTVVIERTWQDGTAGLRNDWGLARLFLGATSPY